MNSHPCRCTHVRLDKQPLAELQISNAAHFFVKCYNQKTKAATFENSQSKVFNFYLEQLPPTSESINKPIKHAYYQYYMKIKAESNEYIF